MIRTQRSARTSTSTPTGTRSPLEARLKLAAERVACPAPVTMEEYCLATIGPTLYRLFFEGYACKLWGHHPGAMPASAAIRLPVRLPVRLTRDDRYFSARYQGVPAHGYTALIEALLEGVPVDTSVDFSVARETWMARYDHIMRLERALLPVADFQGCAVVHHGGRLVLHPRGNMDQIVLAALSFCQRLR